MKSFFDSFDKMRIMQRAHNLQYTRSTMNTLIPRLLKQSSSLLIRQRCLWCKHTCTTAPDQKRRFVSATARQLHDTTPPSTTSSSSSSPFDKKNFNVIPSSSASDAASSRRNSKKRRRTFIPRVAAVQMTDQARTFFKQLLGNPTIRSDVIGIMLNYDQSKTGEPRMVFSFSFVTHNEIDHEQDEGVSLEMIPATTTSTSTIASVDDESTKGEQHHPIKMVPKPPVESRTDGLPKLYVHHNAFLKVLGATIDVDTETITPILYDREGNRMDPNA